MRGLAIVLLAALAACSHQTEEFSSEPPSLHVAQVALDNGQPAIAASIVATRLAREPGNTDDLLMRAKAEAALGQTIPADADFRQVLANEPGRAEASLGLARLIMASDPAAAEALLLPVAIRGEATAAVWNNLGVARDLQGRHGEAQDAYRKAIVADPSMKAAEVNLARSLSLTPPNAPPPPFGRMP